MPAFRPLGGGGRSSSCGSFLLCTAGFVGCRSCLRVSDLCVGVGLAWASLGWLKAGRSLRRRSCISGAAGAVSPACAVSALRQLVVRLGALRHRRQPGDHLPQLGQVLHHLRHHSSHAPPNTPSGQTPPRNGLRRSAPPHPLFKFFIPGVHQIYNLERRPIYVESPLHLVLRRESHLRRSFASHCVGPGL